MKKVNSKLKNVTTKIAMVSIIVFPLVALMHATFAWFLAQRNVNNGINGIVATLPNKVIDKLYVFQESTVSTGNDKQNIYRQYKSNPSAIFDVNKNEWWAEATSADDKYDKLGLGTYSSLYPLHSSLMVLKVNENVTSDDVNKFSLNIVTRTSYEDSLVYKKTNDGSTNDSDTRDRNLLKKEGNPLSSIVTFNYMSTIDSEMLVNGSLNSKYTDFNSEPNANKEGELFLDKKKFINGAFYEMNDNKDGVDKEHYFPTISIKNSGDTGLISINTKYIVIMVEYFNEGLQYIYSLNIGNDVLSGGKTTSKATQSLGENDISFICDWSIVGQ